MCVLVSAQSESKRFGGDGGCEQRMTTAPSLSSRKSGTKERRATTARRLGSTTLPRRAWPLHACAFCLVAFRANCNTNSSPQLQRHHHYTTSPPPTSTVNSYGGVLRFQRTDGDPVFVTKQLREPIRIVFASTGITSSTTKVVGDVRAKKEAEPEWFEGLLKVRFPFRFVPFSFCGEVFVLLFVL